MLRHTDRIISLCLQISSNFRVKWPPWPSRIKVDRYFPFDENPESNGHKAIEKKTLLPTPRRATVDNFQGEEAKVIVVSLVRSNSKSKVGFLRTENRINVLLIRAQHGMYLIGNTERYLKCPNVARCPLSALPCECSPNTVLRRKLLRSRLSKATQAIHARGVLRTG